MSKHWARATLLITFLTCETSCARAAAEVSCVQHQDPLSGTLLKAKAGEVLVRFAADVDAAGRNAAAQLVSGTLDAKMATRTLHRIKLQPGDDPFQIARLLASDPRVEGASPNILGSYEGLPSDPGISNWWFADQPFQRELETYFDNYVTDERIVIVLMDSGIDFEHEEFKSNLRVTTNQNPDAFIRLFDNFTEEEDLDPPTPDFDQLTSPRDFNGHGTTMAGLIAAIPNNGEAIAGLAYGMSFWIFKIGTAEGVALPDLIAGFEALEAEITAGDPDLRYVVNLSLGWTLAEIEAIFEGLESLDAGIALLDATDQVLMVTATGNNFGASSHGTPGAFTCNAGSSTAELDVKYPAAFSGDVDYPDYGTIIAVGGSRTSTTCEEEAPEDCLCTCESTSGGLGRAEFSRYLPPHPVTQPPCVSIVDLVAPAGKRASEVGDGDCASGNMFATELSVPEDRYRTGWDVGTSYSTAITTAVAAAVWARDVSLHPAEVKFHLKKFAHKGGYNIENNVRGGGLQFFSYDWCLDPPEYCEPLEPDCPSIVMDAGAVPEGIFDQSMQIGSGVLTPGQTLLALPEQTVVYITGGQLVASTAIDADRVIIPDPLTIQAGVTLTLGISPTQSQTVYIAKNSALQLVIEGTIAFLGPVEFRSYELEPHAADWAGIVISGNGQINSSYPVAIRHAATGLHGSGSIAAEFANLELDSCLNGIIFDGGADLSVDDLLVIQIASYGIWVRGGGDLNIGSARLEFVAGTGVLVQEGALHVTDDLTIVGSLGVFVTDAPAGSDIHDLTVTNCQGYGLVYTGDDWTLGPSVVITGAHDSGIVITGPGEVEAIGPITVQGSGLHGIALYSAPSASAWSGLVLESNGGDGLHVEGGSIQLASNCLISQNTGAGVWVEAPEFDVDGSTIQGNAGTGIVFVGEFLHIASAVVKDNLNGVFVDAAQNSDLGTSEGDNDFSGNTNKFIVNLRPGTTVNAQGNYWGAQCPPKASKFVGTVNYANCHSNP